MRQLPERLPFILLALHFSLFLTTEFFGDKIASGGNPLFCVDLPVSLPLVASDSTSRVIVVGIMATTWWYFIGKIASEAWRGKVSRIISVAGALLLFLLGAAASFFMISEFRLISQEPNFGNKDFRRLYAGSRALVWRVCLRGVRDGFWISSWPQGKLTTSILPLPSLRPAPP